MFLIKRKDDLAWIKTEEIKEWHCDLCHRIPGCFYCKCEKLIEHSSYCEAIQDYLKHEKIEHDFICLNKGMFEDYKCKECKQLK